MNDEKQINLRKYRKNIKIYGISVIAYGIWGVLKFVLLVAYGGEQYNLMTSDFQETFGDYATLALVIFAIAVLAIIFAFNLVLGLSAIRCAKGKKKKIGFVIVAIIYFIFIIASLPTYFISGIYVSNLVSIIGAMIVDVCIGFILADMVVCSIRMNKILKEMEQEN